MLKKNAKCSKIEQTTNFLAKQKILYATDKSFKDLTTIAVGGKIPLVVFPKTAGQLKKIVRFCFKIKAKTLILGRGSNILANDTPFDGIVICTKKLNAVKRKKHTVLAQCGVHTVALAWELANWQLSGGEFLHCLPATIGGAVVMNAGCFGMETQNIVENVKVLTKKGKFLTFPNKKCNFGYRNSIFLGEEFVIAEIKLKFTPKSTAEIKTDMKNMLQSKLNSQPLKEKSMGCVFFNQNKTASMLIDRAGLKGTKIGGAVVSTKHAGFFLNQNDATASDILQLMTLAKQKVSQQFGENLQTEVRLVNFDPQTTAQFYQKAKN